MGRAPCCDKANVKRGPWSPEEDAMLKAYIEEHGTGGNWIALPHKIGLKRCGKSCRLRWLNYLRPNIKHGGFSEEEDNIICNLYISIGSRWSIIAAQLPGRTDNDIKNYWNTRLKKKLLGRRRDSRRTPSTAAEVEVQRDGSGWMSSSEAYSQTLNASAIERMQLHMQLQGLGSPFSFNNHALWPKLRPIAERQGALQAPQSTEATIATSGMQQQQRLPPTTTLPEPSSNVPLPSDGEVDANSLYGFPSASDSDHAGNINKGVLSTEEGLQEELMSLIHAKNTDGAQSGDQQQLSHELDCFKEVYSDKDDLTWWANNCFVDKSSSSSWESASADLHPESIFQDYMLGYDV